jgi:hypothetical protein
MTIPPYTIPAIPQEPIARPTLETACHGALRTAESRSTAQKWTIVGVPNASISRDELARRDSATSAITTNCSPVSAAADDPMIT